jgi:hypothetical protein
MLRTVVAQGNQEVNPDMPVQELKSAPY